MNEDGETRPSDADQWIEALTWHDRLRDAEEKDLCDTLLREWRLWYADVENQRIFDNVSRMIADRSLYRDRSLPSKEELDADEYDLSAPIAEWRKAHAPGPARKKGDSGGNWWRRLAAGFAAATIGVLAIFRLARYKSARESRRHR